ncbi:phage tail spike protein [Enterococcus gallinarum]|uniref:phage tail spike protein n=1 Tax=Enterococcus gallinarum TaxID=1353 RepID=UPI0035CA671D
MDFYFTDRKFNFLGIASTSNEAPISIYNDKDELSISAAARTIEGTLIFSDKERDQVKVMANYGNYILYKDENGQSVFMTIMEIEHDPKEGEHFIRAEDAGMDLINGLVDAYNAPKAMTFAEYFKLFAGDTGFEIGINEISNLSRTLKWESESQTILTRLLSLATQFDNAEISFSFEITGTQVVKRFVDVRKKRGADNRVTLYMDKDINNIVTKANIYDLCTAIVATGGTPEGKNEPINLKGYNYKDPNGRFVLNKTTGVMLDMESVKIWSRLLSNNNPNPNAGHIQRVKTYETTDQKTLCDNVIRELEKVSQPAINYETDIANLPDNVKIGDTIYLVDENEKLFLSARVLELTRCYSTNEYKATLGDYLIQDGGISQSLKELADQLKQATTYVWIRYADDEEGNGISALPAGKTYIAIKQVLGVPTASDDPADYRGLWVKFVGEGVPGPPGENGQPTYTWLKYADDYQGTNMTDDPTGKYYIGLATNKLTATESNDPKDYKWQLVKGEDGQDAHIYQAYLWSPDGTDRFTTTYPNENLATKKSLLAHSTNATNTVIIQLGKITFKSDGAPYLGFRTVGEQYKPATQYTMRFVVRVSSGTIERIGGHTTYIDTIQKLSINGTQLQVADWATGVAYNFEIGKSYYVELTFTTKTVLDSSVGASNGIYVQPNRSTFFKPYAAEILEFKVEQNTSSTIYTPSPEDDFINAYPSYVGTYTTFDDVQSTNPADYTWQRMLGLSGEDGKDGEQGPQGVPGPKGDNGQTYYTWLKYADTPTSGMSDSPTGKTYIGLAYNKASATESTNYADYNWSLIKGSDGAQGPKGDNGQTLYTWIKYATSPTGAGMSDSPTGKTYIGLAYNKTTATESTNAADYTWSLIKGDKGDTGATGPQGPQGPTGPKGDRGLMGIAYVQQTQPSDKTEGVQWFKTDSTDKKIIASYVYKSGAWQEKKYASATLAVESLDALSASLGKITSGEINGVIINGSQFISPFDKEKIVGGSNWVKGTLTNADGMSVLEWTEYVKSSGQTAATGKNIFYYDGVSTSRTRGSRTQTSYFGVDGIQLIDTDYSSIPAATLTIEDLFKIGATELSPASGFSIYSTGSTNLPTARRNGRIVQLAGAFKNNNAITVNAEQITIGYVPEWARPDQATNTVVQGSGMNRFMLVVNPGGAITISRYGTTSYTQAVAGSWLNIACVYSAKDM